MRIQIPTTELKTAIVGLAKVINQRAPVPILASVRLDAEGQSVRLTGTSIDQTAVYAITVAEPVPAPVSTLIPIDVLQAVLKTAQGPSIEIEPEKDAVTIVAEVAGQNIGRRIETADLKDWPDLAAAGDTQPVEPGFLTGLRQALTFASPDDNRPLLKAAFLDVSAKSGHRIVATDSRRLSVFPCGILPLAESVIVPSTKFLNWTKLEGDTRIGASKGVFTLRCGPWVFTTKVVEGQYPRWSQVVPDYGKDATTLELSPEDVQVLVKTLPGMPGNEGANGTFVLRMAPNSVRVCSKQDAQSPEAAIRLEKSVCSGAAVSVGLDRRFFRDALLAGFDRWQIRDSTSPLVGHTKANVLACHVLMPVRSVNVEDEPAGVAAVDPQVADPVPVPVQPESIHKETTPMKKTEVTQSAQTESSPLDKIMAAFESAKTAVRQAQTALGDLAGYVRDAVREDKSRQREIAEVRVTLQKLQAIRV